MDVSGRLQDKRDDSDIIAKRLVGQEHSKNGQVQSCCYSMDLFVATTKLGKLGIYGRFLLFFFLYLKQRCEDRSLDHGKQQKVVYYSVFSRGT